MVKVIAISSFEHQGRRARGAEFEVSPQHADLLRARGLVKLGGNAVEGDAADSAPGTGGGGSAADGGTAAGKVDGALLIRQKIPDAVAAISQVSDRTVLEAALTAEKAKGDKARAAVLDAIDSAMKAAATLTE